MDRHHQLDELKQHKISDTLQVLCNLNVKYCIEMSNIPKRGRVGHKNNAETPAVCTSSSPLRPRLHTAPES